MNRGAEPTQGEDDFAIRHRSCRSGAAVQPPGLSSPGRALEGATPGQVHRFEGPERTDRSKKHVAGQKGTPFSRCVTAMAKLANGNARTPRAACAAMSKTHPAGEKGTPYSRCVAAGAKLLKDQHR